MKTISIGQLAKASGSTISTIRYYESIGLLPKAKRGSNGHRYYQSKEIESLRFLRLCREFGFSIDNVRELFVLRQKDAPDCNKALAIVRPHI